MENKDSTTNTSEWCASGCCGPSESDFNMDEMMKNCNQMMMSCCDHRDSDTSEKSDARPTAL